MEDFTEPLISGTHNQENAVLDCDDDHCEQDTETPVHIDEENNNNNNNYVQLIDNEDDVNADSTFTDDGDNQNEIYSLDPRRYAILAIFCLNNLIGSAVWITFAPIEDAVKAKFQQYDHGTGTISLQQINWFSMVSMAIYGPGTALCAWIVPKYGFRETVVWSSVMMALGCFLRWLSLSFVIPEEGAMGYGYSSSTVRYSILLAGQGLVALGQTIFMNAPARVAASWFQQTTKAIGAINLCSNLGIIFGQALPPLCVVAETGEHLDQLLGAQGLVMALCTLFTGYSFRYEEPPCPPSASEAARRMERRRRRQSENSVSSNHVASHSTGALKDVEKLLTNPQYVILMIAFGINYGLNGAVVTLMEPWLASCGFPGDKTAGLFGSLLIGGGVVATWIASTLLDITRNYNQAIRWSFASTAVVAVLLVATLYPQCPTWILATAFTMTGMTQMPLMTICTDAVAAHTYPVSEELSSAGLQMVGQYLGVVLVDGMSYLIESESQDSDDDDDSRTGRYGFSAKVNIAYIALLVISSICACSYKSDDLRANTANHNETQQNSSDQTMALLGNIDSHDDESGAGTRDIDES